MPMRLTTVWLPRQRIVKLSKRAGVKIAKLPRRFIDDREKKESR
jgi:hypothetical protein